MEKVSKIEHDEENEVMPGRNPQTDKRHKKSELKPRCYVPKYQIRANVSYSPFISIAVLPE